jgi:hypothetical protein
VELSRDHTGDESGERVKLVHPDCSKGVESAWWSKGGTEEVSRHTSPEVRQLRLGNGDSTEEREDDQ